MVVIDVNEAKFQNLSAEFSGFRLEGDASELEILKQAKTLDAHKLIAVTRNDNVNLTIAQIAKTVFHVPTVVARVSDPQREAIFRELGIHTVSPVLLAADGFPSMAAESVLVAWKDVREARRAVADAMPFLTGAREVLVACIEEDDGMAMADSAADVVRFLMRHGVKARSEVLGVGRSTLYRKIETYAARGFDIELE